MLSLVDHVADYATSDHFMFIDGPLREHAETLLLHFCRISGEPLTIAGIEASLGVMARLDLPLEVRRAVPQLLIAFFEFVDSTGLCPGASSFARDTRIVEQQYLRSFRDDGSVRGTTFEKKCSPIGRNDPCPCGSGKKFKKCCGREG